MRAASKNGCCVRNCCTSEGSCDQFEFMQNVDVEAAVANVRHDSCIIVLLCKLASTDSADDFLTCGVLGVVRTAVISSRGSTHSRVAGL